MYGFMNEDGEPIMDAAAYRYEQYLDGMYEPDPEDSWDGSDWGAEDDTDPLTCEHFDGSYPEGAGYECDRCDETFEGPRLSQVINAYDWDIFWSRNL